MYKEIYASQAKQMMDEEDVVVIDVRDREEYEDGHIENAISLPLIDIKNTANEKLTNRAKPILVYCSTGRRSKQAAVELTKMGYRRVYDFGGLIDWQFDIVK